MHFRRGASRYRLRHQRGPVVDVAGPAPRHARPCKMPVKQPAVSAGAPRQSASVGMLVRVWSAVALIFPRVLFSGQYAGHERVAYKRDMCMQFVSHRPSITMAVSSASAPRLVRMARPRGARARREHRLRPAARGAGPPGAAHARHQTRAARRAGQVCARQATLCVGLVQASASGCGCMASHAALAAYHH